MIRNLQLEFFFLNVYLRTKRYLPFHPPSLCIVPCNFLSLLLHVFFAIRSSIILASYYHFSFESVWLFDLFSAFPLSSFIIIKLVLLLISFFYWSYIFSFLCFHLFSTKQIIKTIGIYSFISCILLRYIFLLATIQSDNAHN